MLVAPHLEITYTVGLVTGSASQTPGQANLTKAGNIDWAAWGNGTTNFDNTCTPAPGATLAPDVSKAGGGDTISNLTNIGTNTEAFVGCHGPANPFSFSGRTQTRRRSPREPMSASPTRRMSRAPATASRSPPTRRRAA